MYYLTATPAYPGTPFDTEIVRVYDDFDAAIEWGEVVAESEDYCKVIVWYREEIQRPDRIPGGIYVSENVPGTPKGKHIKAWAKERIMELSENIAITSAAIEYLGWWLLHGFYDNNGKLEANNISTLRILADLININEKNRAEILRIRRDFEV